VGLTRVAIARPVFMLMVIMAMILLGLVSFFRLNAELYPPINTPVVTVLTTYPGAAPEDVRRLISEPIEDAVAGIANVDVIQSSSGEGSSQVTITFTDAADINVAATDVERRISAVRAQLPDDAESPTVLKLDPTQLPVLYLAYTGTLPLNELYRVADERIQPSLETQNGVGSVDVTGGVEREIQVQVNPDRLRAYGITLDQISQALSRENQGMPGGSLERGRQQTNLRLHGLIQSVDELRKVTIPGSQASPQLGDVATVVDTYKRTTTRSYLNGQPAIGLTVTKQSGANEIATVNALRAEIDRLNSVLPSGSYIYTISDTSTFTRNSLNGVQRSLMEAVLLTGLVLLVFLHTFRSTAIVLFSIPTSLISTFMVMNALGFTLNIMSSMALVLVVGVLVDDSIVVLENIFRHLEHGSTPREAAIQGRSEIGLAAIAITLVDVVVFTPVAFMSGTVGSFFRQFGLVIAAATLLSLFISFTLTPLLASRWLQPTSDRDDDGLWQRWSRAFERFIDLLRRRYERTLGWALRHRWAPPLVALALLIFSGALIPLGYVKGEFIPQSDNGYLMVTIETPPGSSLEATEQAIHAVEDRLANIPEIQYYLATSGTGGMNSNGLSSRNTRFGRIQVVLVDLHHRTRSVSQIADQISAETSAIPDATIRASVSGGAGGTTPVQVLVTGEDPAQVDALAARVEAMVRAVPNTRDVTNSGSKANPETRLVPDRDRLADFGVSAQQVALALRTSVEGQVVTELRPEGVQEVDVRLIADDASRASLSDISNLPVVGMRSGQPVPAMLGQLTKAEQVAGPATIDRRNRQIVITIGSGLVGNTPLGEVTTPIQRGIAEMRAQGEIPTGYNVQFGGQAADQAKAFVNMLLALGLSVILEYMLLAALYESMILPFATMFALPLAIIGAFLALAVTGNTLNLLSMIGVVVLMGLVGKNGILLVDYTNSLRRAGQPRNDALRQAGGARLRPILMTTMALVCGMMPLALKLEEGSEIYVGMATVIIGGMLSSTFLSLLVVPCMYTYFDDFQTLIVRLFQWRPFRRRPKSPRPAPRPFPSTPYPEPSRRLERERVGSGRG
jgi:hydrophobic/amphiphilic exporter-1 (mainly G- bacteria), HAE1 family